MPFSIASGEIDHSASGVAGAHSRPAGIWAGTVLVLLYAATAAPSVTWWDAGEFIAAAHTLGIPHPPGTPLYVMIGRVWSELLGWMDTAHSINLLSSVCTALAAGVTASWIARITGRRVAGIAAALCAGTMSTVWLSATEAEVYGPALLLAMLMLWSGDRAGRTGDARYTAMTAYLFAIAGPLHVIALVAGPAAVLLAASGVPTGWRWKEGLLLGVALVGAAAVGTGRWPLGIAAVLALAVISFARPVRPARGWIVAAVMLVGVSSFAYLMFRARQDPAINQGNPLTFAGMLSVIARDQYAVAGLLPRQAPVWLQTANFLEYADWQVALGLGPTVMPTIPRTTMTIVFVVFGVIGSLAHRQLDRRSWRAVGLLGVCGSIGVIAYLNLKAGPSIGYGIIPDDAPHEPRERDYFFMFAFWTWGIWAGIGAMALVSRWLPRRGLVTVALGLTVAALPAALNLRAMNRRAEPEGSLPLLIARELLAAAPERAMLLVAGDNDTYPLWFAQHVLGLRPDVVVLTHPLLGADWYRAELHRRWQLGTEPAPWRGSAREMALLAESARLQARPLAAAVTVERRLRDQLTPHWRLRGLVYVESIDSIGRGVEGRPITEPSIDRAVAEETAHRLEPLLRRALRPTIDPTGRLMRAALFCPSHAMRAGVDTVAARLLDSTCNYR